jgi:hypothetical protein
MTDSIPSPAAGGPALTVAFGTMDGWPAIRPVVLDVAAQVGDVGGELVVADGSGKPAPKDSDLPRGVRWSSIDNAGIFDLRLAALREARGEVIGISEDHCLLPAGWCRRLVDLHRAHDDVDLVLSAVENASRDRSIDWAGFIVNQWPYVPPIDIRDTARQLGIVGVSIKRRALRTLLDACDDGPPDLLPTLTLAAAGLRAYAEPSLVVGHVQSESWLGHAALHFHNARAIAGLRRTRMTRRDWTRLLAAPLLVPYRARTAIAGALRKEIPRRVIAAAVPGIFWLALAKGAGDIAGYLTGPGDSARKMH